jgi:hypothetical protein
MAGRTRLRRCGCWRRRGPLDLAIANAGVVGVALQAALAPRPRGARRAALAPAGLRVVLWRSSGPAFVPQLAAQVLYHTDRLLLACSGSVAVTLYEGPARP